MRFVFVPCLLQMLLQLQFSIPAPLAHGAQLPGGRRAGKRNVVDRFARRRPHRLRFLVLAHNRIVPRLRDPGQGLQAFSRKERGLRTRGSRSRTTNSLPRVPDAEHRPALIMKLLVGAQGAHGAGRKVGTFGRTGGRADG
jgi:hypothetical protein